MQSILIIAKDNRQGEYIQKNQDVRKNFGYSKTETVPQDKRCRRWPELLPKCLVWSRKSVQQVPRVFGIMFDKVNENEFEFDDYDFFNGLLCPLTSGQTPNSTAHTPETTIELNTTGVVSGMIGVINNGNFYDNIDGYCRILYQIPARRQNFLAKIHQISM